MRRLTCSLFMPTLNEQAGLSAMLPRIDPRWFDEVLVVDGNSTDGTASEVAKYGYRLIHQKGRGLVDAWNTGFENTSGDIFIVFTPDGNCIPELLPTLIAKISDGYDMVSVSRYLPPAKSHDDTFISALGNYTFTKAINLLFGAHHTDTLGGYRAYRRDAILAMNLHRQHEESHLRRRFPLINTWEIGAAIRSAKLGLRTIDIPGDEPVRWGGISKMSVIRNGTAGVTQIGSELLSGRRALHRATARPPRAADGQSRGGAAIEPVGERSGQAF